jgi:hypothetical protein
MNDPLCLFHHHFLHSFLAQEFHVHILCTVKLGDNELVVNEHSVIMNGFLGQIGHFTT